jgi:predicted HicB family RNase H-like nuclease
MVKQKTTVFSIRVPIGLKATIRKLAKKQNRSVNNFILVSIKKEIVNSQIYEAKHENVPNLGQDL